MYKKPSFKRPVVPASFIRPTQATVGPTRFETTLIYAENGITLNPGLAGIAASYVFSFNSLFDPNLTGAGHQPAGFDQLMAIYEQYLVYGVAYKIQGANSEANLEAIHGVTITDQISANSDPRVNMENGQTQFQCVGRTAGNKIPTFSGYVDLAKLHGIDKDSYMRDYDYMGTATTGPPGDGGYLHLWAAPINATSDIGSASLQCHV